MERSKSKETIELPNNKIRKEDRLTKQEEEWDMKCLILEIKEKLSKIKKLDLEFKIPDFFTRCHAKRSITLIVEGREIYASKQILKLASPVFHSMFELDFREKEMETIELPGKTCQEIILLLSCIYPNILEQIEDDEPRPAVIDEKQLSPPARRALSRLNQFHCTLTMHVNNFYGTAEQLQHFFRKLNTVEITASRITGVSKVVFEDKMSAACAYCMDNEVISEKEIGVSYCYDDPPDALKDLTSLYSVMADKGELNAFFLADDDTDLVTEDKKEHENLDTWNHSNMALKVQEKLDILLKLADEYQMESVLRLCDERYLLMYQKDLKANLILKEMLIELLQVADRYRLQRLCDELCKAAQGIKLEKLEEVPMFEQLSVETRFKLVSAKLRKLGKIPSYLVHRYLNRDSFEISPPKKKYAKLSPQTDNGISEFQTGKSPYMSVVIKTSTQDLYASKEVLALSSPVFRDKIAAVQNDQQPIVLNFPAQNYNDFLCLLQSIHPDTSSGVNEHNVRRILELADLFQVRKLYDDCDVVLEKEFTSKLPGLKDTQSKIKTATEFLLLASENKLSRLLEAGCEFLAGLDIEYLTSQDLKLPRDIKIRIYSRRIHIMEEEQNQVRIHAVAYIPDVVIATVEEPRELTVTQTFKDKCKNDVCLVVQGKNFYADEDVLSIASPVLKERIEQNLEGDKDLTVLSVDLVEEDLTLLLRCIYPNIQERVDKSGAMKLLHFVEEYQMKSLCRLFERCLVMVCQNEKLSSDTIVEYITKANTYQLPRLIQACKAALRKMCREDSENGSITIGGRTSFFNEHLIDSDSDDYHSMEVIDDDLF